jgi:hypothetical protein
LNASKQTTGASSVGSHVRVACEHLRLAHGGAGQTLELQLVKLLYAAVDDVGLANFGTLVRNVFGSYQLIIDDNDVRPMQKMINHLFLLFGPNANGKLLTIQRCEHGTEPFFCSKGREKDNQKIKRIIERNKM